MTANNPNAKPSPLDPAIETAGSPRENSAEFSAPAAASPAARPAQEPKGLPDGCVSIGTTDGTPTCLTIGSESYDLIRAQLVQDHQRIVQLIPADAANGSNKGGAMTTKEEIREALHAGIKAGIIDSYRIKFRHETRFVVRAPIDAHTPEECLPHIGKQVSISECVAHAEGCRCVFDTWEEQWPAQR